MNGTNALKRNGPPDECRGLPCSIVGGACAMLQRGEAEAAAAAIRRIREEERRLGISHRSDGYLTLAANNKLVRALFGVKRRRDFKRGERPKLKDLEEKEALVCVYGHFLYLKDGGYWSYFDNADDEVVALWELKPSGRA